MKHLVTVISTFLIAISMYGQDAWYEPNRTYTFESLSADDSSVLIQLEVIYDVNGNCTITKKTYTADSDDKVLLSYFGSEDSYGISSSDDTIYISASISQSFWVIPYDTYEEVGAATEITIVCNCKKANGESPDCTPSIMQGSSVSFSAICVPNTDCDECDPPKVGSGINSYDEGILILEANGSLTLQTDP